MFVALLSLLFTDLPSIHTSLLGWWLFVSCFNTSCEYWIFQALFSHCVQGISTVFPILSTSVLLFPFFIKLPHCWHAQPMIFSVFFGRTTSLLPQASSSWRDCPVLTAMQEDWHYIAVQHFSLFLTKSSVNKNEQDKVFISQKRNKI